MKTAVRSNKQAGSVKNKLSYEAFYHYMHVCNGVDVGVGGHDVGEGVGERWKT